MEQANARSATRESIYRLMYNEEYEFSIKGADKVSASGLSGQASGYEATKSYIPPSDFNPDSPLPFGENLDPPLM
jgi:hypothetical protein